MACKKLEESVGEPKIGSFGLEEGVSSPVSK